MTSPETPRVLRVATSTMWIDDGQEIFPCRCGTEHSGDYALEDWSHHNCFHNDPEAWVTLADHILTTTEGKRCIPIMCMECGFATMADVLDWPKQVGEKDVSLEP